VQHFSYFDERKESISACLRHLRRGKKAFFHPHEEKGGERQEVSLTSLTEGREEGGAVLLGLKKKNKGGKIFCLLRDRGKVAPRWQPKKTSTFQKEFRSSSKRRDERPAQGKMPSFGGKPRRTRQGKESTEQIGGGGEKSTLYQFARKEKAEEGKRAYAGQMDEK